MADGFELAKYILAENHKDQVNQAYHAREAERVRGTVFHFPAPLPRTEAEKLEAAREAKARNDHWRTTQTRKALQALSGIAMAVENARAEISRAGVPDSLPAASRSAVQGEADAISEALALLNVALCGMAATLAKNPQTEA